MDKWRTGTPPKGQTDDMYALCLWYDGWWLSDYLFKANHKEGCFETVALIDGRQKVLKFSDLVAWQKITPYKEGQHGALG